jgi:hypothetical protein
MLLSSTDTPKYRRAVCEYPSLFGWFLTPRKRGIPRTLRGGVGWWGVDNDCFNLGDQFDLDEFLAWLRSVSAYRRRCLLVPCPDVMADWRATLAWFHQTRDKIASLGFRVAVVLQDGCTGSECVPWNAIDAVFVGGSTEYKLSQAVLRILEEAGRRGKWRHVGRVNSKIRISHFWGRADSFDGGHFSREPDYALTWVKSHLLWHRQQLRLF